MVSSGNGEKAGAFSATWVPKLELGNQKKKPDNNLHQAGTEARPTINQTENRNSKLKTEN
ncbi:MAG: hypothetical protein HY790_10785 [Deltaproteobacteria bacterium]|nr:hypothetical protein [Deltaproteobacteria bacterium]